jgi:hypothetical protein
MARPDQVVSAIELGFDIFSGSYPMKITQNIQAMMFETQYTKKITNVITESDNSEESGVPAKRIKLSESQNDNRNGENVSEEQKKELFIDLKDTK